MIVFEVDEFRSVSYVGVVTQLLELCDWDFNPWFTLPNDVDVEFSTGIEDPRAPRFEQLDETTITVF